MNKKRLLIRADANKEIGMGHVMRCLTIAEAAKNVGMETVFLVADAGVEELLKERGQTYRILHTDFSDMEGELPKLFQVVETCIQNSENAKKQINSENGELQADLVESVLLLDSYRITESYVQKLKLWLNRRNINLALMEDYGNVPYHVDVLINYNIYGVDFSYEKNAPKSLLGCKYMPLRQAFVQQKYEVREQIKQLLITTGGSDSYGIAVELVKRISEVYFCEKQAHEICMHVVCGKFSQSTEKLLEMANHNKNLIVHTDVKEMWKLMTQCDLAISAAGTTLYELCAIGVPTVCFSFAENQILPGTAFAKYTPMYYAGDYEKDKNAMFASILEKTKELCLMSKTERQEISSRLKEIVDGKGAERIISEL